MEVTLEHVAIGGNAISNAFSGNHAIKTTTIDLNDQFPVHPVLYGAYGAKNGVALVSRHPDQPSELCIVDMLYHRTGVDESTRITSIFLYAPPFDDGKGSAMHYVLAGDAQGNVFLWNRSNTLHSVWTLQHLSQMVQTEENTMHASVSAVTSIQTSLRWIFLVALSNGTLVVYERLHVTHTVTVASTLKLGVKMIMETLALTVWQQEQNENEEQKEESVLVAAGGVDSKIYIYEIPPTKNSMTLLFTLEGHRQWIRSVAWENRYPSLKSSSLLLASASQDRRIRLWKLTSTPKLGSSIRQSIGTTLTSDGFQAHGESMTYTMSFDSLLLGHEDWVTSVHWTLLPSSQPDELESALMSSSMDNTIIVWKPTTSLNRTWMPSLRVGEHGGNGILSSIILFSTGSEQSLDLLALNFSGQLERWSQERSPSTLFRPALSLTGHTAPVTDVSWSPDGRYVVSVSLDQTTRVWSHLQSEKNARWYEISRAQVHGYDINCGTMISTTTEGHNDRFVCGADEKILRVFEAPDRLLKLVQDMTLTEKDDEPFSVTDGRVIQHAYLPELSLTNKSNTGDNESTGNGYVDIKTAHNTSVTVPVGDTLAKKTLWPEQRKLYGHGNELLCVASNPAGTLIASACKSREERFASIWLWNTSNWSVLQAPLQGHKSSVVQLSFSPNNEYLASVSKDRQFCVFQRQENGEFTLVANRNRAHKRIIWTCSWSPDSKILATGSRDQTFTFWCQEQDTTEWQPLIPSISMDAAITAISFAPWISNEYTYLVAIGLEHGAIYLYSLSHTQCTMVYQFPSTITPAKTISRLCWSPFSTHQSSTLACGSTDHSIRLYHLVSIICK